ncbi:uncharacterized protein LOC134787221 [Penaeus indicus]|uniref:uncharacterized protein LOC134787221 n=1 Tax=Penaeus indicus TaxID=29960 RepID=UPI00300D40FA
MGSALEMASEMNLAVDVTASEGELKSGYQEFPENSHLHDDLKGPGGSVRNNHGKNHIRNISEEELEILATSREAMHKDSSLMKPEYTGYKRKVKICNLLEYKDSETQGSTLLSTRNSDTHTKIPQQSDDALSLHAECPVAFISKGCFWEANGASWASPAAKGDPLPIAPKHTVEASNGDPTLGSPSFIMVREASVEGVFIYAPTPSSSEPEMNCSPTAVSQQSPFRRQLFTSLMTRQSALVSRINQQTSKLMRAVEAATSITQTDRENKSRSMSSDISPDLTSTALTEKEDIIGPKTRCCPSVKYHLGEDLENESFEPCGSRDTGARDPLRLVSICDSGIGFESDEDAKSLSRHSSYTLSEDSEGPTEETGKP